MQFILVFFALSLSLFTVNKVAKKERISRNFLAILFLEHVVVTVFYMNSLRGDWVRYYNSGVSLASQRADFNYFSLGTQFIMFLNHFFQSMGDFSVVSLFILFSLAGYIGIVFFVAACRPFLILPRDKYWMGIFLLPNIHLWTCAIGKDALVFLPICYILYQFSKLKFNLFPFSISISLVFMIRPHIAMFLMASGIVAVVLASPVGTFWRKSGMIFVTGLAFVALFPVVQAYTGFSEASVESVSKRIEFAASKNQKGGGAVDITGYSPPLRLATYLFRPLFFDVRNYLGLAASVENLVCLLLFLSLMRPSFVSYLMEKPMFLKFFVIGFVLLTWVALGMTTANLGIAMRQKTQFIPHIYLLVLSFRHWRKNTRNDRTSNYSELKIPANK